MPVCEIRVPGADARSFEGYRRFHLQSTRYVINSRGKKHDSPALSRACVNGRLDRGRIVGRTVARRPQRRKQFPTAECLAAWSFSQFLSLRQSETSFGRENGKRKARPSPGTSIQAIDELSAHYGLATVPFAPIPEPLLLLRGHRPHFPA